MRESEKNISLLPLQFFRLLLISYSITKYKKIDSTIYYDWISVHDIGKVYNGKELSRYVRCLCPFPKTFREALAIS